MLDKTEAGRYLPDDGRVLFTCKNGKVTATRVIYDDEHVASLKALIELVKMAGYTVVLEDEPER